MRLCTAPSSLCFGALRSPSEDNFAFSILILHKITHAAQSNSACALELQLEQPRFSLTPFVPREPFFFCLLGTLPASRDSSPLPSNRCQSGLTGNRACRGTCPGSHSKTAGPGAWPSGRLRSPPGRVCRLPLDFVHVDNLPQISRPHRAQLLPQDALARCVLHGRLPLQGFDQLAM